MAGRNQRQQNAILVIDDEEGFVTMLRAVFARRGYTVHTTSCAHEAIQIYRERSQEIDVVLLDFLLPDLSGDMVFENLQQINPDVRVVLLTACDESVAEKMYENGLRAYIQKPFCVRELLQIVRDVVDDASVPTTAKLSPV